MLFGFEMDINTRMEVPFSNGQMDVGFFSEFRGNPQVKKPEFRSKGHQFPIDGIQVHEFEI